MTKDDAYLTAFSKLEAATRIWKEKRENEYQDAERMFNEAVQIRNEHFK